MKWYNLKQIIYPIDQVNFMIYARGGPKYSTGFFLGLKKISSGFRTVG